MNYQLEQTGEQVQDILNQAPTTEQNLQNEITRSTGKDEELETAIGNEKNRAEGVEAELQTAIGNENARAEGVEAELQTAIANEKSRAEGVEGGLRTDVDGIEAKIPTGASEQNKLATESFVNSSVATNTADFKGTFPSLEALQTEVHDADANDYAFVISTDAAGNTVYNRYKYVTGTGWVFEYALNNSSFTAAQWAAIQSGITALLVAKLTGLPTVAELTQQLNTIIASVSDEQTRAEGAEALLRQSISDNATAIANEKTRAQNAEGTLSTNIVSEENRAKAAEVVLQQNIDAEAILRDNADDALQAQIDGIDAKIPEQASASNQLADKSFVNSSIATNTADFKGTYNSLQELQQVSANNNDYGFVVAVDSDGNTVYNRYKYVDGTGWVFEYALNNSSFTSAQWAAIQSGITAALVAKLNGLPDITALNAMFAAITNLIPSAATSENKLVDYAQMVAALATKQNTLTFDNVPTEGSNNPVKSGGVYTAIATVTAAVADLQSSKQDVLTFDAYPTAGSDNPVKSKGIYEKLAEKQATLVPGTNLDTTPTANSNNPVTSGGVKSALDLKANQSALAEEVSRAQGAESALGVRVSTNEADIAQLRALYNSLQESKPVPVTALPSTGQQQGVIYRLAGTTSYSDYMWNGSTWVLMATYNNAIDDEPTTGSDNLVKSGGVAQYVLVEGTELNATSSDNGFYLQDLTYQSISTWVGRIIDIEQKFQNDGIIVDCAPRSNAYTSLVDSNNNILWQSNLASDFPKQLSFTDYPNAEKLYVSSEKSIKPNPYCKLYKKVNEAVQTIQESLIAENPLVPLSVRGGFYQQDLTYSSDTANWLSPLYEITDEQKVLNKGIYIDAAPRSAAYVSITDANDNILWQSNDAEAFPKIISFIDYPSLSKIYLSNEFAVKTYKAVFLVEIKNIVKELGNDVSRLAVELSRSFFSNKLHSNNYDSTKKVTLPSYFQDYTIPIDISRDGNVFGWSTDVKRMQKNNEYTATYYCSPNGNDENSGLTLSEPLKTIDAALAKTNLNTLILLPGVYVCNEHFTSNLSVNKEINIIGIGSVEMRCNSASEYPIHLLKPCYIENIVFNGGHGALNVTLEELSSNKICVFYKCKFINSHSVNGLNALGGAYYLEECEASNNRRDGFNYHNNTVDNNTIYTRVIEINCCGYFNGLNHDSYINNGSTTHDSGRIIRIYCEYGSCKGSVVADANRTRSLNIGVTAYSTANIDGELDSQKANFAAQEGSSTDNPQVFYIIQCSSFGSLFDIYADNNAIIYRDTHFPREGSNGTATIVDYDLL